jgi:hypothetical protein
MADPLTWAPSHFYPPIFDKPMDFPPSISNKSPLEGSSSSLRGEHADEEGDPSPTSPSASTVSYLSIGIQHLSFLLQSVCKNSEISITTAEALSYFD